MSTARPATCSVCGVQLKQQPRGRARLYCSNTCRVRAQRRAQQIASFEAYPESVMSVRVETPHASFDEQVTQALIQSRTIGFALQRLGTQARPELAWRCTVLGNSIIEAIRKSFPELER